MCIISHYSNLKPFIYNPFVYVNTFVHSSSIENKADASSLLKEREYFRDDCHTLLIISTLETR